MRLFERRHRALALTEAGQTLYAAAAQVLATMRAVTDRLRAGRGRQTLAVTTTQSFASLWLIPRLAGFTRKHPELDVRISAETRVLDLERDGLDLAIRHGPGDAWSARTRCACSASACSRSAVPKLMNDPDKPLREPADLRHHVLLQYDDPDGRHPWMHWKTWLEVERLTDLRPAGSLVFSGYDQIIPAAIAGHGVALGRSPLVRKLLASGELVAPFKRTADPGARLLRHRVEALGGPAGSGRLRRLAEGRGEEGTALDLEHDLADVLRGSPSAVRLARLREREGLVDHRLDLAGFDQRPDFLAQAARDRALELDRARPQRRAGDDEAAAHALRRCRSRSSRRPARR